MDITRQVRQCWRKMLAQRAFRSWREKHGCEWVIAEEVTRGKHGWHPHLHALLMPDADLGDELAAADVWFETWASIVDKHMGSKHVPLPDYGVDLKPTNAETYLTKLGFELTDAAAAKGSSALQLLADGRVDEYLWLQHARHGARDITYSRGLRPLRDTLPTVESEPLFDVSQLQWNLLRHKSATAPLEIATAADPTVALQWWQETAPVMPDGTGSAPTE